MWEQPLFLSYIIAIESVFLMVSEGNSWKLWSPLLFFLSLLCVLQYIENIQTGEERGADKNAFIHMNNLNELSSEPVNTQSFFCW